MIRKYLSDDHARLEAALQKGDYESFREGFSVTTDYSVVIAIVWSTVTRFGAFGSGPE